ncbi:MAG: pyruvate kinase [Candidatus Kapabacteria bacterium]|nr:pyruvate kinase [Candidatus Kapabacteria bacterium]
MTTSTDALREHLLPSLEKLKEHAMETEEEFSSVIEKVQIGYRDSARNLAHYLALRRADVRELQDELSFLGLSSLGRSESCVMSNLENVIDILRLITHDKRKAPSPVITSVNAHTGPMLLREHARKLLGPPDANRAARIMVTMPSEASTNPRIIRDLMKAGMDIMRINMAHDGPDEWLAMIKHMRDAEQLTKRTCMVHIDLAGPKFRIGPMERIRVKRGSRVRFVRGLDGCACDMDDRTGETLLHCCEPEAVYDAVRIGDPLWIDDGKIAATVIEVTETGFLVKVTRTKHNGAWLRAEKGINFPETKLELDALTDEDVMNLTQMGRHADIIGMSFVRTAQDVASLFEHMHRLDLMNRGVVAKIETRDGFEHLPQILFEGLRHPPFGIMVARGDLAVEIGYERLAEVQEEMLWLCEAAHVPIIWATQVLEGMAKKGIPSRAEVSDAAMSVRAECVMLNKGPYIVDTVQFLSGILHRMAEHQSKKRTLLRKLSVSGVRQDMATE